MLVTLALWRPVMAAAGTTANPWQTVAASHMLEATAQAQVGYILTYALLCQSVSTNDKDLWSQWNMRWINIVIF